MLHLLHWALACLACLASSRCALGRAGPADEDLNLIGWKGDTYNPKSVFGEAPGRERQGKSVQLSEHPRAFMHADLLSAEEARHIVQIAAPRMKRSMVGSDHAITETRTSYGMFIPRYQDEVVARVEERVAKWTGIPVSHQEEIQVLRYAAGQQYKPHFDANGRICTVLIYLVDTAEGGETAFSQTNASSWLTPELAASQGDLSECAAGHVAVKPAVGTGLLFWSMPPEALHDATKRVVDPMSEHRGCPPIVGHKWTVTIWIHYEPFRPADFSTKLKAPMADPGVCGDFNDNCQMWKDRGECDKNRAFMIGEAGTVGNCRKVCGVCEPCPPGDLDCVEQSRVSQGYLPELKKELQQLFGVEPVSSVGQQ